MPDYAYIAADDGGAIVRGTRFANSEEELAGLVRSSGLHLLEFRESGGAGGLIRALQEIQIGGAKRRDLIDFSNSMAVMFRAGVPLISALDELRQDMDNKTFRRVLGELIEDIQGGENLHEAIGQTAEDFSEAVYECRADR